MTETALEEAIENIRIATVQLYEVVDRVLQAGTPVFWEVRGHRKYGHVVGADGRYVLVRNSQTGDDCLLHVFKFTETSGGGIIETSDPITAENKKTACEQHTGGLHHEK